MASWKQINEVGGTVILRGVSGLIALGIHDGFVVNEIAIGKFEVSSILVVVSATSLSGGYTVFGNRLSPKRGAFSTSLVVDAEDNPQRKEEKS